MNTRAKTDYRPKYWSPTTGTFQGPVNRTAKRYWSLVNSINRLSGDACIGLEYHGWSNRIWALIRWAKSNKSNIVIAQIEAARKIRANL